MFPLFDAFLADIGDAQSIEQNLSTFSAHITNLERISQLADASSLVLLDELGSATDPEEGAALAVAIADYFLERRAWCLISTHHTSLKLYAAKRTGVLNASVGFDEETLAPTFALRLGVPGASAGINIAQRLGLNSGIIANARGQQNTQTQDIAHFLDQLHSQLDAVGREREELKRREQEVAREKNRLESEGLKEWRAKVRDLEQQLQSLLKDFTYQIRETVRAIDDRAAQQKLSKEAERRMARLRREFSEQFNSVVVAQHSGADRGDSHAQPHLVRHVSIGDTVKLKSLGKTGVVQRQVDGNAFEVAVGPMKMRVARDDIAEVIAGARDQGSEPAGSGAGARGYGFDCSSGGDGSSRAERDWAHGGRGDRRSGAVPGSCVSGWAATGADRAWYGHGGLTQGAANVLWNGIHTWRWWARPVPARAARGPRWLICGCRFRAQHDGARTRRIPISNARLGTASHQRVPGRWLLRAGYFVVEVRKRLLRIREGDAQDRRLQHAPFQMAHHGHLKYGHHFSAFDSQDRHA